MTPLWLLLPSIPLPGGKPTVRCVQYSVPLSQVSKKKPIRTESTTRLEGTLILHVSQSAIGRACTQSLVETRYGSLSTL